MTAVYDARGNVYAIATPDDVRGAGVPLPADPATAARHRKLWAGRAIAAFCGGKRRGDNEVAKRHEDLLQWRAKLGPQKRFSSMRSMRAVFQENPR